MKRDECAQEHFLGEGGSDLPAPREAPAPQRPQPTALGQSRDKGTLRTTLGPDEETVPAPWLGQTQHSVLLNV